MPNNTNLNANLYQLTSKDTVPASTTGTGTIEVIGTEVIGTGTKFKTELKENDFIVDFTQDEIRRVVRISDDTNAYLDLPFTINISAGTTPKYVQQSRFTEVSWRNAGAAQAGVNGTLVQPGDAGSIRKTSKNQSDHAAFVDPTILDGATSKFLIQTAT